jgi:hypothetical protein
MNVIDPEKVSGREKGACSQKRILGPNGKVAAIRRRRIVYTSKQDKAIQ